MRRPALALLVLAAAATGVVRSGRALEGETPVPLETVVRSAIAKAGPGVVRIEVDGAGARLKPERRFFRDPAAEPRDSGAGVVLRADGLILTHAQLVAFEFPRIEVLTPSGRRLSADLIARDQELDVALLKVDTAGEPLTALELGTTTGLETGRFVVALGNPFGVARDARPSSGLGVVTSVGPVDAREVSYSGEVVFTDAAINPGNEGGPLVDLEGRMLGLIAPLARDRRSQALVGYAIPIDAIAPRLEALARGGSPGRLGVLVDVRDGALVVARVVPGSPAETAGVKEGDRLLRASGQALGTKEDLRRALSGHKPGARIVLALERAGRAVEVEALLGGAD